MTWGQPAVSSDLRLIRSSGEQRLHTVQRDFLFSHADFQNYRIDLNFNISRSSSLQTGRNLIMVWLQLFKWLLNALVNFRNTTGIGCMAKASVFYSCNSLVEIYLKKPSATLHSFDLLSSQKTSGLFDAIAFRFVDFWIERHHLIFIGWPEIDVEPCNAVLWVQTMYLFNDNDICLGKHKQYHFCRAIVVRSYLELWIALHFYWIRSSKSITLLSRTSQNNCLLAFNYDFNTSKKIELTDALTGSHVSAFTVHLQKISSHMKKWWQKLWTDRGFSFRSLIHYKNRIGSLTRIWCIIFLFMIRNYVPHFPVPQ